MNRYEFAHQNNVFFSGIEDRVIAVLYGHKKFWNGKDIH